MREQREKDERDRKDLRRRQKDEYFDLLSSIPELDYRSKYFKSKRYLVGDKRFQVLEEKDREDLF